MGYSEARLGLRVVRREDRNENTLGVGDHICGVCGVWGVCVGGGDNYPHLNYIFGSV